MSCLHDGYFTPGSDADPELAETIHGEPARQQNGIELIVPENMVSRQVWEGQLSSHAFPCEISTMATILTIARANIDRVWHLTAPLVAGGRNSYKSIDERYGGGGFYTGIALVTLKHRVRLAATIADDPKGRRFRSDLIKFGFDVEYVKMVAGQMKPVEVLVDPWGERTIIAPATVEHGIVADLPLDDIDVVYVNARRVEPRLMEAATERSLVVAQAPLEPGERRPCHFLIASHSDLSPAQKADPLSFAQTAAGDALRAYIVTDGARPVRIYSADGDGTIPVCPLSQIDDSSGAGDVFCAGLIDALTRGLSICDSTLFASFLATRFLADRARLFDASLVDDVL